METPADESKFLDLYSRQIGTYGLETMQKLISLKVLICGCRGVGTEAAKNLTLAGVHTVGLFDPSPPTFSDLGQNFSLSESSVGVASRAFHTANYIRELNMHTRVITVDELHQQVIKYYDVIIFTLAATEFSVDEMVQWNEFCRAQEPPISFILAFQSGVVGSVFVDHGKNFTTIDPDGHPTIRKLITEIVSKEDKAGRKFTRIRFSTPEGQTPGSFRDFTRVKVSETSGITDASGNSINGMSFHAIHSPKDASNCIRVYPSFEERGFSTKDHTPCGFLEEEKLKVTRDFMSLKECLKCPPPFIITDARMDGTSESQVHLALCALLEYGSRHDGKLPPLLDDVAAEEFVKIAEGINEGAQKDASDSELNAQSSYFEDAPGTDEMPPPPPRPSPPRPSVVDPFCDALSFFRNVSRYSRVQFQPLASAIGAITAQEVVKRTGKYTPIEQFLHMDYSSILDHDVTPASRQPQGNRYDDLVVLFGQEFVDRLHSLRLFQVGSGALGCEDIKNLAMCGMCIHPRGKLVVTDNDRVELSNLSRQFLFREDNVGKSKSQAARNRVLNMNPQIVVEALQEFVGRTTETIFHDRFWGELDGVINALDNMTARLYVDEKCVLHEKVLVESSTRGTSGNVDIIVPGKTESYSDGGAADESGGIPMCTLRNFPYIFEHCIEWSRSLFDDLFVAPVLQIRNLRRMEDASAYCDAIRCEVEKRENQGESKQNILERKVSELRQVLRIAAMVSTTPTMQDCVLMAWKTLFYQFRDRILDLIHCFPPDAKSKNGEPFWSGHRRFPVPLSDANKQLLDEFPQVADFLISAANLYACVFGIHPEKHPPKSNDPKNRWMSQYRLPRWLASVTRELSIPQYVEGSVGDLTEDEQVGNLAQPLTSLEETVKEFESLIEEVQQVAPRIPASITALDFEKDDDDNFHIDFVAAAACLRAHNYGIPPQDRMQVKLLAGRIIPAIATTTSAVAALALIEYFKVLLGKDPSILRNGLVDLGVNNYVMFERSPPKILKTHFEKNPPPMTDWEDPNWKEERKVVCFPSPHTKYTKIWVDVTPSTTIADFVKNLEAQTSAAEGGPYSVVSIGCGKAMVWNGLPGHSNFKKPICEVVSAAMEAEIPESRGIFWKNRIMFDQLAVFMETEEEHEVELAKVVLRIS